MKILHSSHVSHESSVKTVPLPLATTEILGTAAWRCVKTLKQRQHLQLQGLHSSRVGRRWFSGGMQVGKDSGRLGSWVLAWGTVATQCLRAQLLPLRRLRVGDTLRAFANCRAAQHPVQVHPLGLCVGVPRPSRSGGPSILINLSRLDGLPHFQALLSDHFEIRVQGLAWRQQQCLTASGNLNWAQAAET